MCVYALSVNACVCACVFTPVEPIVSESVIIMQQFPLAGVRERERQRTRNTLNHQMFNKDESMKLTSSSLLRPISLTSNRTFFTHSFMSGISLLSSPLHTHTHTHTHTRLPPCLSAELVPQTQPQCTMVQQTADVMGTHTHTHRSFPISGLKSLSWNVIKNRGRVKCACVCVCVVVCF